MNYQELYQTYLNLKEKLEEKKQAIIKKNLENLHSVDEELIVICEKLKSTDMKKIADFITEEEKINLKALALEIKKIENDNEILIKHSLDVINNLMSGILNIAKQDNQAYNAQGKNCSNMDTLGTSSITEEA